MAILINGDGNPAVYANQDSDFYAAIMGGITGITPIGNQFNYNLEDANTISVEDGVIITKEGRRIQLDKDEMDLFTIPVGLQGQTTYYIIGYELKNTESGTQICDTFLEQMDDGTATIEEEEFRDGADSVKVSLYRVKQEGLTITTVTKLLGNLTTVGDLQTQVATISEDLNELKEKGMIPILDYDNPLHNFTSGNLSYTTTKECYLVGSMASGTSGKNLAINGKEVCSCAGNSAVFVGPLKLDSGVTLVASIVLEHMYVLEEKTS